MTWTAQEKWVWKQACKGKIADFNCAQGYGGRLNPKEAKGWPEDRVIRPAFLETILLHEPYRGALTHKGLRIVGAWFKGSLDLSSGQISRPVWLNQCRFDSEVDFMYLRSAYYISLEGSIFRGKLRMQSIHLCGHLFMGKGAEFRKEVDLRDATIEGQVTTSGLKAKKGLLTKFNGVVKMGGLKAIKGLFIHQSAFDKDIELTGAKISTQVYFLESEFKGKLIMNGLEVEGHLLMRDCLFMKEQTTKNEIAVDLVTARIRGGLDLSGSKFKGKVSMRRLEVSGNLQMGRDNEFEEEVNLHQAAIGGQIEIVGAQFKGKLKMNTLEVGGTLFIKGNAGKEDQTTVCYKEVDLIGAKIGGQIDLKGSRFKGNVIMDNIEVGGNLIISKGTEFSSELRLVAAKIQGNISIQGSTHKGNLLMEAVEVAQNVFMTDTSFERSVNLTFSKIKGGLDISKSNFTSLNLTGTKINQDFCLGSILSFKELPPLKRVPPAFTGEEAFIQIKEPPIWSKGAKLTLRNTYVGNLQDIRLIRPDGSKDSWPDELDLTGFTYTNLGGLGIKESFQTQKIEWMENWLQKSKPYSPQPYQQLAGILKQLGYVDKSRKILYRAKERERVSAKGWDKAGLTIRWIFIGHGYHTYLSCIYAGVLLLIGWVGLMVKKEYRKKLGGWLWCLFYSLDRLLPIVELDERFKVINLTGFARSWFYIQTIMGYFLVTIIILGISGLIK